MTTREFLAHGYGNRFGTLVIVFGDIPRQIIGVFVFVAGLVTALSSNIKGARKKIQKAYKTFMRK